MADKVRYGIDNPHPLSQLKTARDAGFDKYPESGAHTACVKVVEVIGCHRSIAVEVNV